MDFQFILPNGLKNIGFGLIYFFKLIDMNRLNLIFVP